MGGSLPCRLIVESDGGSPRECWATLSDLCALVRALPASQKDTVLDALNACPKYQRDVFEEKLNEYIEKVKEAERENTRLASELAGMKERLAPFLAAEAELEARRARFRECSPMSANSCPRCGDCECVLFDPFDVDDSTCPLHSRESNHACPPIEDESALPPSDAERKP
jgi:hypothetical protein